MQKKSGLTACGNPTPTQDGEQFSDIGSDQSVEMPNLGDLIVHIEQTHHVYTRSQLSKIVMLLDGLSASDMPQLTEIKHCCVELQADLIPHLLKEERILFPYILELSNNPAHPPQSCFGSIANPIRMMGVEYEVVESLLTQLRALTENYHPASASAPGVVALYVALAELDSDLVEHIYREGEVLFPRALQLEKEMLA